MDFCHIWSKSTLRVRQKEPPTACDDCVYDIQRTSTSTSARLICAQRPRQRRRTTFNSSKLPIYIVFSIFVAESLCTGATAWQAENFKTGSRHEVMNGRREWRHTQGEAYLMPTSGCFTENRWCNLLPAVRREWRSMMIYNYCQQGRPLWHIYDERRHSILCLAGQTCWLTWGFLSAGSELCIPHIWIWS